MNANMKPAEAQTPSMELVVVQTAITKMDRLSAGLADLQKRFGSVVFDVKTPKGMAEAKAARREIAAPRIEVERIRKEAKAPILELGRKLDAEAKRITAELEKVEGPIDQQIVAEENRIQAERDAVIAREQARVADITARIQSMRDAVGTAARARTSAEVVRVLADIQGRYIDAELYAEYKDTAALAKREAVAELERIRDEMVARETEAERLRKDREELDRRRAEQDERDKVERDRRQAEDAEAEKARKAAADLANTRMSEIHAMGHQVIIATVGRMGVRKGGTRECIAETLAETEAWDVTEEKFGPLLSIATAAKASACDQIEALLKAFDQRAENERIAAEQRAEQDRIAAANRDLEARQQAERDAQEKRDREAREAEEARQREETEAREKKEREALAAAEAAKLPTHAREFKPDMDDIIEAVAEYYVVEDSVARGWILDAVKAEQA